MMKTPSPQFVAVMNCLSSTSTLDLYVVSISARRERNMTSSNVERAIPTQDLGYQCESAASLGEHSATSIFDHLFANVRRIAISVNEPTPNNSCVRAARDMRAIEAHVNVMQFVSDLILTAPCSLPGSFSRTWWNDYQTKHQLFLSCSLQMPAARPP